MVRLCETCKKNFNRLEEAKYALTLDSLPTEEAYLCEYHAMILVQDLARHWTNFKLKSLIDGTVYLPTNGEVQMTNGVVEKRSKQLEALARELVRVLKHIERLTEMVWQGVGPVTAEIRLAVEGALEKAEEVLGDEIK